MVWGIVELALLDTAQPVWYPYYGSWIVSLVSEAILLALRVSVSEGLGLGSFEIAGKLVQLARILIFLGMPLGVWALRTKDLEACSEESSRLLGDSQNTHYGALGQVDSDSETAEARERMIKKIEASGNWWTYAKSFALLWPYVWPKGERWLQFSMVMVGCCLLAERGLNVMVPHQLGVLTDSLTKGEDRLPWIELVLYVTYRWLDSGSGVQALQQYLWMPVDQYSYRTLTTAAYNHVMALSYDFHSNKKTGEVWHSISQGRSVNGFIESMLFQVLPMLVDLCVAFAYFFIVFDVYMALIVAVVSVVYLWTTTKLSAMKSNTRRDLNTTGRNEITILIETLSSWTTVSVILPKNTVKEKTNAKISN